MKGIPHFFRGYALAHPKVLESLKSFGFNIVSIANNHSMDFSHKGLNKTIHYLDEHGLVYAGAGMNLTEASAPKYVECRDGRVALISVTSSFHDSDAAGMQSVNMAGRPGVNPLRHKEVYQLTPDLYESLLKIEKATGINDYRNMGVRMGYLPQNDYVRLRDINFQRGMDNICISTPNEKDVKRIVNSVHEAKLQADCVIISIHSHQFRQTEEHPDDFIIDFCHICIEEGADIIFGHGSHYLRGIESYKQGIIFYGLADFILQNEQVEFLPVDFYEKYDLGYEYYGYVAQAMNLRSNNRTKGLCASKGAWESIAASCDFENGLNSIKLYPISLQYNLPYSRRGWPVVDFDRVDIIENVIRLSEEFGTNIRIQNGMGIIEL